MANIFCNTKTIPVFNGGGFCLLCVLIIGLTGCGYKLPPDKLLLKPVQDIVMQVPFEPYGYQGWAGWTDSANKKTGAFYLADLSTSKQVMFLNEYGVAIDSIPIRLPAAWQDRLQGLIVYNRDTVAATSEYDNNHTYFFNHHGELYNHLVLPTRFGDTLYEANGHGACRPAGSDRWFFNCEILSSDYLNDTTVIAEERQRRRWASTGWCPLALAYRDVPAGRPSVIRIGSALRARFVKNGFAGIDGTGCPSADGYYYATPNADSIYKFSAGKGYELDLAVPMRSRYGSTYAPAVKVEPPPAPAAFEKQIKTAFELRAGYCCMKWDAYRHLVYLTILHEVPSGTPFNKSGWHRRWSLFIFNEQLGRLAEVLFQPDTYDPRDIIISPHGILLRKTNQPDGQQARYTRFEVVQADHH